MRADSFLPFLWNKIVTREAFDTMPGAEKFPLPSYNIFSLNGREIRV